MKRIVVANRVQARVYHVDTHHQLVLDKKYENPMGRLRDKDMQYDQPGVSRAKKIGATPHNLDREKSPHEDASDQFAKRLSRSMMTDLKSDHSLSYKIVAEPKFLGKLKATFKKDTLGLRIEWVEKDLEKVPYEKWPELIGL